MTEPHAAPDRPFHEPDVVLLDVKGLRALAHPLRVQLVALLRKRGPSTATRLADWLGVNSGTTSYHLRQLGAAGFVEEDPGRGNARERWWRSIHQTTWFADPDLAERETEAALAYLQSVAAAYILRTQRVLNNLQAMPRAWRDAFDMSDWPLQLTPEEARALRAEIESVVARYRTDVSQGKAEAPEGAERVTLVTQILPEPETSSALAPHSVRERKEKSQKP